jgi:UrcA family protein
MRLVNKGALALASLLALPSVGYAATTPVDAYDVQHLRVRIADLDLRSERDVERLYHRLQAAATHVCTYPNMPFDGIDQACRASALQDAISAVHSNTLEGIHARSSNSRPSSPP